MSNDTAPADAGTASLITGQDPAPGQSQAQSDWREIIPESFREASWATKYKTADDFFKGVDWMNQTIGKKNVVQGIELPGEDARPEDWDAFYNGLGRPEKPDGYELPELKDIPEGFVLPEDKQFWANMAHKHGLTKKQAAGLFSEFMQDMSGRYKSALEGSASAMVEAAKQRMQESADALKGEWGDDFVANLNLAKRAAEHLGILDSLDQSGAGNDPAVLKLAAELGKMLGEDNMRRGDPSGGGMTKEEALAKITAIKASPEYNSFNPAFGEKRSEVERLLRTYFPGEQTHGVRTAI